MRFGIGKAREVGLMWSFHSTSDDPYHNLALEDRLLSSFDHLGAGVLIYVNRLSVILGKNQVPWRECDMEALAQEGIPLARRISGGGTVVHDPGNLNLSLFLDRNTYRAAEVYDLFVAALRELGVEASVEQGNSLFAGGRKFSGQAFCYRKHAVLHHATFLVASDLARIRALLRPSLPDLETRAIASRPSPVVNLSELSPGLTVEGLRDLLLDAVAARFGALSSLKAPPPDRDAFASESWVIGHTPAFSVSATRLDGTEFRLAMKRGAVIEEAVVSDARGRRPVAGLVGGIFDLDRLA